MHHPEKEKGNRGAQRQILPLHGYFLGINLDSLESVFGWGGGKDLFDIQQL